MVGRAGARGPPPSCFTGARAYTTPATTAGIRGNAPSVCSGHDHSSLGAGPAGAHASRAQAAVAVSAGDAGYISVGMITRSLLPRGPEADRPQCQPKGANATRMALAQ